MRRSAASGQAATEYVALLLVVAVLLALTAVAVPGVGERVVDAVRTAICIVGGDVCRSSDAAAASLSPCVTSARSAREETALEIAVVRLGEHGEWQLTAQSDGQALVTRLDEKEAGATVGVGLSFSPAGVEAGLGAAALARYQGGRAWRFPDVRAASAFLEAAMRDGSVLATRAADVRWHALGGRTLGEAGVAIADLARAGVEASATSALGLRSDGPRRTLTLDLGIAEPHLFVDLPGFPDGPGKRRTWIAEVAWEGGAAREVVLRAADASGARLEEFAGRLDLHAPGNRAVAARVLRPGSSTRANLRALAARIRSHGVIEFSGYEVSERRRGFSVASRLGVALGLSHERIASERRLVDAVAWIHGGPLQRRFDCLGV